jgi:multidrug transporter EmrE-like cation transporter
VNFTLWLLIADALLTGTGAVAIRFWADGASIRFSVVGILLFNIGTLFWLWAMRNGMPLSRGTVVFGMLNLILETMAGLMLFGERLTTVQWVGVVLSIVSLVLIEGKWAPTG